MATLERESFSSVLETQRNKAVAASKASVEHISRGDYLTVFFNDEPYYAERIDDLLTIYRSMQSNVLIGCKIKGVSIIARNVVNMIDIDDDECSLSLLLLNAAGPHAVAQFYFDVSKQAEILKMKVPVRQILSHNHAA